MVGFGSRGGRIPAGTLAALLLASGGGCAPAPLDSEGVRGARSVGQAIVLARFHRDDNGEAVAVDGGFAAPTRATLWRIDTATEVRGFGGSAAPMETSAAGWVVHALAPGRYLLRIDSAGGRIHGTDFTFVIPPAVALAYIGSFPMRCIRPQGQEHCFARVPPVAESPASFPRIPGLVGDPATSLATPFDAAADRSGWPLPTSIEVSADGAAWRTSVNWLDFVDQTRSRGAFRSAGRLMDAAAPIGSGGQLGALVVSPLVAAALVSVAVGAAAHAGEAAEANRTEQRWTACLQRLGAAITPESLAGQVPPPPVPAAPAGRQRSRMALDGAVWQASVTRVTLRRCGEPTHLGVETAVRWRSADREAHFVRQVPGPRDDPALVFSRPAPWEAPLMRDWAACRPLEAYCAAGGEQLVLDEVGAALLAGRDALLASRQ